VRLRVATADGEAADEVRFTAGPADDVADDGQVSSPPAAGEKISTEPDDRHADEGGAMGTEEPQRTGEEAALQQEMKGEDQAAAEAGAGTPVADDPGGTREEKRRANYIDQNADEDGDPATTERTYREGQGAQTPSVDSTPPTSSTTPTPPTSGD
jgi:hypothetical protein